MEKTAHRAIAIVGVGAVLPDAPNVPTFWENVKNSRYSISEVTPDRWDSALYYDPDPTAPDKTYSKIGGWVREASWDPMKWRLPIPPRVAECMDGTQKWAIACTREALEDFGYPKRPLDLDRTAVILGNAMAGEKHYLTALRVFFPEYASQLDEIADFAALPKQVRQKITRELHERMGTRLPQVTEDSMPGELSNCIAGRLANIFNFHGPNYVVDAACASAMAAISSATEGLIQNHYDVVVTGGVDRNMGAPTFVKFCKIGALSGTGSRPYAQGADGFVMGEGAAIFLLKRLADAERDGDKIYAVLRGMGGSSDGKGKGITAPNPVGQRLCVQRGWKNAGLPLASATLFEGHGTSTRAGDMVEGQSMVDVLSEFNLPKNSIALGSVKSNFGHLKGAAGAAGLLKTVLALRDKILPPSLHCEHPSPEIDFAHSPLYVNTTLKPWEIPADGIRRAGLSAFGFGGTNFHAVLEEYIPGRLNGNGKHAVAVGEVPAAITGGTIANAMPPTAQAQGSYKAPLRGALVIGAESDAAIAERLLAINKAALTGVAPAPAAPAESDLRAPERLAIDYTDAADLADKSTKALKAVKVNQPAMWKALRPQGIFRGHGPAGKVAFLYTGQGSQYVNMLRGIREKEPIVADSFKEADKIMEPLLGGKPLTDFIYLDAADEKALTQAEDALRQTAVTQPAVITINIATTRLLAAYGIRPDMTMGHSVGEYGALVASGAMPFEEALEAVSARGREMTRVSMKDNGKMAAVFAPIAEVERILKSVDGYLVIANVNSNSQSVVGGETKAIDQAAQIFLQAGYNFVELPVSHAFHTSIVAPASEPLKQMLSRLHLQSPQIPIIANINGEFYPTGPDVGSRIPDILAQQVAAPVQFVKGLRTLYDAGARVFVEVGPKKALQGFAEDVLGSDPEVFSLFTNHPKLEDLTAFNQALCGMYAAGLGCGRPDATVAVHEQAAVTKAEAAPVAEIAKPAPQAESPKPTPVATTSPVFIPKITPSNGDSPKGFAPSFEAVTITGASLGLPGTKHIFDDGNMERILRGDQFITPIPAEFRQAMLDKRIRRLVKSGVGEPTFESITDVADVLKLAGRGGEFDLQKEFGVPAEHLAAFDRVTRLAIAVGIDAMRDAGIPMIMRYKTTTKGTKLPERWGLPDALRDETGVIFGSAFPGCDSFAEIISGYFEDHARREELTMLESLRASAANGHSLLGQQLDRRIEELRTKLEQDPYVFDRRFLLRVLSMGHSQFAELIGARGPNTQINSACATTAQAVSLAEDWIRAGRCRRVIVISADDVTSDNNIGWFGPGFLASGTAATDEAVEDAAIPFDRRRHGLIMGMGAAALVVESAEAARERGIQPICEILSTVTANSAFHGTRLDVQHIGQVMEDLVSKAELRTGIQRKQIAPEMVFVSHETYTPARGGSASAEVHALRKVFGDVVDEIVIANTKGYTGHAMATGIEDVLAVKALETGLVPPVANFKEVDPELGSLNLSKGGSYPVEYALHLGAGFGSQISMMLLRWVPNKDKTHRKPNELGYSYRIADSNVWNSWLSRLAGRPTAELEVVHRTLRVKDNGPEKRVVAPAEEVRSPRVPAPAVPAAPAPRPIAQTAPAAVVQTASPVPVAVMAAAPVAVVAAPALATRQPSAPLPAVSPAVQAAKPKAEIPIAVAAPPAPPNPKTAGESVKERILTLMVEKTGYPEDMLDLDLDLEADLGVDTVKQAEMFAAIREIYNIPRDENRKLRDYPTLAHVIRFVYEKRPDLAVASAPHPAARPSTTTPVATQPVSPAPAVTTPDNGAGDPVRERILELMVEKTGYPKDMLDLDLDLEADLGVDTVKQAEMFAAIREIYNIPRDENRKLRDYPTLAHVIRFVYEKRPDLAGAAPSAKSIEQAEPIAAPVAPQPAAPAATVVAVAAQPVTPAPVVTAPAIGPDESVKDRILELMVEKTGYPKDMLDLDLDLEADLGVDTVKQAEMFAAIREIYNIPRDENRKLRDYPTLAHVIRFVYEKRPDLAGTPAPQGASKPAAPAAAPVVSPPVIPAPVAASPANGPDESVRERILELMVEKTGYPKDMLDLDLDLEADLGVDTVKQAEMFAAIRAIYNIPRDENRKLRDYPTLAHVIRFVYEKRPDLAGVQVSDPASQAALAPAPAANIAEPSAPATASAVAQGPSDEEIKQKVLDIVAEKTGYPKDMLDLDLDLEADLGIDTVKQAEMFAAIRSTYNIPRDENLKLREFPTLNHVIGFAQQRRPGAATPAVTQKTASENAATVLQPTPAKPKSKTPRVPALNFEAAERVPRRVAVPNLRPPLNMCKSTGVKLAAGNRVVIMPDQHGVADALKQQLQSKGVEVLLIEGAPTADALTAQLNEWIATGPVQGVYWLPALDNEGSLMAMDLAGWREALRVRVKLFYHTMRALYEQVFAPGTFLVSAVRLGGQHGYDEAGAVAPLGGAVAGFTKTYKRERPDVLVKTVDFEPVRNPSEIADTLIQETLRDPGAVEIGYKDGLRWTVGVQQQPVADGQPGFVLDEDSVFLVTGAAGSIVSAITADLANASGGTFYLLDLVPEPDPNNPDLKRFVTDKDDLKRDLFERIKARGERATPAMVEKELAALERAQAAQSAIDAVHAAGGTAHYFSVNLTDGEAVARIIEQVRQRSGRIDVLLHAAGIERSHFLPDKDPREFDLVFDVKSDGWFNLLRAIGNMPLGATVAFSSVAGRFGNGGQSDYSSANDLLCKITSSFRTTRPGMRGIAIDWSAWGGIGMATRGSIPKMMELAGIDMLPPEAGIPWIRRELTSGATCGEVVVGQRLGVLLNEWDSTGGLDTTSLEPVVERQGPMVGRVTAMGIYSGLTMETTLDPKVQPFLNDHRMDGTPVLPGVMGIEAFAEAALCVHPGWHIGAVEEVNFLAPFKFYRDEPRTLIVQAMFHPQAGKLVADCRLIGRRTLPNQVQPQETTHFTARVLLAKQASQAITEKPLGLSSQSIIDAAEIYRIYFHGPAYQVLERAWWEGDRMIGLMKQALPGNHQPADRPTLMAPRLIELCFQTAGLWEIGTQNRMGLPLHVSEVCWLRSPELAEGPLYAVVTPDSQGESFNAEVVDKAGNQYLHLSGYRTVALPNSVDVEPLRVMRSVMA